MNKSLGNQIYKYRIYFLMILPVILWYIIFSYIPMSGILLAFKDYSVYKGFSESPWVGLKWFRFIVNSPDFFRAFRNTVVISFYMLVFTFPAPIILAIMLNECQRRYFKRIVQTISYLPHFLSWAVISGLMISLLSPSVGFVNQIIKLFGGEAIYFMAEVSYIRALYVISALWKGIGWGSIIYLAKITTIDPQLYESAIIDGAGKFKQIWHITLPSMSSLITMMLVFSSAGLCQVGFEQAYNLIISPTYDKGMVIDYYVYRMGVQQMKYSFGTAVGLANSVISIILLATANTVAKRINDEGAIW